VDVPPDAEVVSDRVLTIPNALSVLRLVGVPVFLYLALGPEADGWALVVLACGAATDYFDGKIARAFGQTSKLGQILDPAADRLYIAATAIALTVRDIVPLWLVIALLARDLVLAPTIPLLRRHGLGPLPVHFLGKAATFNLLYAFPLLLLGDGSSDVATVARVVGWAFTVWGTTLYWWAGVLYLDQVRRIVRTMPVPVGGAAS
jgi:cardiolipin synthase